ncbi:ABC transporter permease [Variovorax sp. PBL-E5]|uniref:ABC transporter permease n=1 Tax=Variovorax sp. PBL-E5 TaxID=434014 RepID=UPI0013189EDF|nr:ABC transporter permease [Variovorax sp. PBL-E5]VTU34612.1 Putrescine transport system permease protein PotH [Variovorax sp. PBL-E5]
MNQSGGRFGVVLAVPLTVLYLVFLVLPLGFFLAMGVFRYDAFALYIPHPTAENFLRLIADPYYRAIIVLTLKLAALTTLCSLLLGYPMAYFLSRTQSAWRGVLMFLVVAPLTTGVIVRTYGWIVLFGAEGLINRVLLWTGLVHQPLQILNTQTAVVVALVHILLPYMIFPLFSSLTAQDPSLRRAASTLGAGTARIFFEVTLPLSKPGILMGSVLVFTLSAGSVVTPTLLGGKNVQMMGQSIYELVLHTLNWPLGSAMASILVLLQFVIIFLYFRSDRRAALHG